MSHKMLVIDPKKCKGCGLCEVACGSRILPALLKAQGREDNMEEMALNNYKKLPKEMRDVSKGLSRIKVISFLEPSKMHINVPCFQCESAVCAQVCPKKAIVRDEKTGAYVVEPEACIGCKLCVIGCPYGSMGYRSELRLPFKCDLCEGTPRCVAACNFGALQYKAFDTETAVKKRDAMDEIAQYVFSINSEAKEA